LEDPGSRVSSSFWWKERREMSLSALEQARAGLVLRHSPIPALRKLVLEETEATIIIRGTVTSYYFKQMAQEAVMPLLRGRVLINRVGVVRNMPEAAETKTSAM
jgi:hypothetical protein